MELTFIFIGVILTCMFCLGMHDMDFFSADNYGQLRKAKI